MSNINVHGCTLSDEDRKDKRAVFLEIESEHHRTQAHISIEEARVLVHDLLWLIEAYESPDSIDELGGVHLWRRQ